MCDRQQQNIMENVKAVVMFKVTYCRLEVQNEFEDTRKAISLKRGNIFCRATQIKQMLLQMVMVCFSLNYYPNNLSIERVNDAIAGGR